VVGWGERYEIDFPGQVGLLVIEELDMDGSAP
jgi:hypothetical protein